MEEHYIKDVGKITYVYGVNLEEHKTVIEKQQKRIAELEQELAELKQKAIVPKFKIGQEIWYVGFFNNIESRIVDRIELVIENNKLCEIYRLEHYGTDDYSYCIMPFDSDRYFSTKQEAQEKLKELKGNE